MGYVGLPVFCLKFVRLGGMMCSFLMPSMLGQNLSPKPLQGDVGYPNLHDEDPVTVP